MKRRLRDLEVGDKVWIECLSSMGASSTGPASVEAIKTKYDEDTGIPYKVLTVKGSDYKQNGDPVNGGMYYIEADNGY